MFTSYYSIAVDLLRRYLSGKGSVSLESFSDSQALFALNSKPVLLSLNDESTVTVKIGKDPESQSLIIQMSQFDLTFPVETLPERIQGEFNKILDNELLNLPGYEQYVTASSNQRESERSLDLSCADQFMGGMGNFHEPVATAGNGRFQRPPDMPDFEDEYETRGKPVAMPPTFNPSIGDADLRPAGLGRYPTMEPYLDPLRPNPHGGMYPDANHPIFGGSGGLGVRPGVPPGARYDEPYSEGNMDDMGMGLPGNLRNRGGPGGPGGHGGFSGPGGLFGSGHFGSGGPGGPFM